MPLHSSTYGIVYSHEMVTVRKVSADRKLYKRAVEGKMKVGFGEQKKYEKKENKELHSFVEMNKGRKYGRK